MNRKLYLFNPDHDLALANANENFNPPRSARSFAADLSCLPMWYALPESTVLGSMPDRKWISDLHRLFPQLADVSVKLHPDFSTTGSIHPWGWDASVRKSLALRGAGNQLLPDPTQLAEIRRLSHRKTAVAAMQFLREEPSIAGLLPSAAQLLFSVGEVSAFAGCYPNVVFKAPWSGSGKGICWSAGVVTDNTLGWCRNIIEKQDCVVGEAVYEKVQDFAMEFCCSGGKVLFAGYSLFHTDKGVYKSNELMNDEAILKLLTTEWLPENVLLTVQNRLLSFIESEIAPVYDGFMGVDMFVYQCGNRFLLHPCVEINLRMTMGNVARIFYDNFVQSPLTGHFYIDHFPSSESLRDDHLLLQSSHPLQVTNGRITRGYLSLSPVTGYSRYRARVEIG